MISPQDMADAVNGGPARLVFHFRARRRRGRDGDTADEGGEEKPIRLSHSYIHCHFTVPRQDPVSLPRVSM